MHFQKLIRARQLDQQHRQQHQQLYVMKQNENVTYKPDATQQVSHLQAQKVSNVQSQHAHLQAAPMQTGVQHSNNVAQPQHLGTSPKKSSSEDICFDVGADGTTVVKVSYVLLSEFSKRSLIAGCGRLMANGDY